MDKLVIEVPSLGSGTSTLKATDKYNEFSVRGGFFRVNYNYQDKYLLEVNGRYDGSSKFPKESRYGFFPLFRPVGTLHRKNSWKVLRIG